MNDLTLMGRIGKDPELRETSSGINVCSFSIATIDSIKRNGEYEKETTWHNCVFFGKQALTVHKFYKKGMMILIKGKVSHKKDNNGVYRYSVLANKFHFTDSVSESKKQDNGKAFVQSSNEQTNKKPAFYKDTDPVDNDEFDNDIPF